MGKRRLVAMGIVAVIVISLSIFVIIPVARGSTKLLTVLGGSMSPAMDPGDVAVVTQIDPSELRVGDIVAYRRADGPNDIVSHRVVDVIDDGELSFRTRGDANEDPDPYLVGSSDVVGKVTFVVPKLGYVFHFADTPIGFAVLVVAPAVLLIAIEIRRIAGYVRHVESDRGKRRGGKRRTVKMRRHERIAAICMMSVLVMASIAPSLVAYTNGHLSDSVTIANNVIAAGVWENSGGGNSPTDNGVTNGENSGFENSATDNGSFGLFENSPTDNGDVENTATDGENSEVTENMATDNESSDPVENESAEEDNLEVVENTPADGENSDSIENVPNENAETGAIEGADNENSESGAENTPMDNSNTGTGCVENSATDNEGSGVAEDAADNDNVGVEGQPVNGEILGTVEMNLREELEGENKRENYREVGW